MYNPINATLHKRLHVSSKHILTTQVDGETMDIFKDLNFSMAICWIHTFML